MLDCCGGTNDAISTELASRGFLVTTNDLNPMYVVFAIFSSAVSVGFSEAILAVSRKGLRVG